MLGVFDGQKESQCGPCIENKDKVLPDRNLERQEGDRILGDSGNVFRFYSNIDEKC